MKVMTYNVLAQSYIKPGRYPKSPPKALVQSVRHALLIRRILTANADVLLLQEVEPEVQRLLTRALPNSEWFSLYSQRSRKTDGSAIWAKRQVLSPLDSGTLRYAAHDPSDEQLALWLTAKHQGHTVGLASTHLRWQRRDTPTHQHLGRKQLQELLQHTSNHSARWILGGDFNAWSQSCVIELAQAKGWCLGARNQRPWDTTNINERCRKIDYLLYQREHFSPSPHPLPKLTKNTPMPSLTEPSDHLPLVIDFSPH